VGRDQPRFPFDIALFEGLLQRVLLEKQTQRCCLPQVGDRNTRDFEAALPFGNDEAF